MKIKKLDWKGIFIKGDNICCTPENMNILSALGQKYVSLYELFDIFFPRHVSLSGLFNTIGTITSSDALDCFQRFFKAIKCEDKENCGVFLEHDLINEKEVSLNTIVNGRWAVALMTREKLLPAEIYYFLKFFKESVIRESTVL